MSIETRVLVKYTPGHFAPFNHSVTVQVWIGPERLTFKYIDPHGRRFVHHDTAQRIQREVQEGCVSLPNLKTGDEISTGIPYTNYLSPRRLAPHRTGIRSRFGYGVYLDIGPYRFIAVNPKGETLRTKIEEDIFMARFERAMHDHAGAVDRVAPA